MLLLLIRHGESEADLLGVHEGRADFELTPRGHRQAEAMAEYVAAHFSPTRIYASTLKRAAQTAAHLSEKTGIQIGFDPDLMEFNNGLLAGLPYDEAEKRYPPVKNLPVDQAVYGQESQVEFRARAEKVLRRILAENDPKAVVAVVTHGGMINQLYGVWLQAPIGEGWFFRTADTGIHIWKVAGRCNYVLRANLDEHARGI